MFAFGVVAKGKVCTKLLLVLGYFIIISELSLGNPSKQPNPSGTCHFLRKTVTYNELRTITDQIWSADNNSLAVNDVVTNGRGPKTKFFKNVDEASLPETYQKMIDLFKNYDAFNGSVIPFDQVHRNRENAFLDAIINTGPIKTAGKWLYRRGLLSASSGAEFKKELRKYWFTVYMRTNTLRSSGFGHTFAGEIYNTEISKKVTHPQGKTGWEKTKYRRQVNGLHNWLRMHLEEKTGKLTEVKAYRSSNSDCPSFIKDMNFKWNPKSQDTSYPKDISTAFIGASPEVEIALSTICLLVACPDNICPIRLEGRQLNMTTEPWPWDGETTIGSSHPIC